MKECICDSCRNLKAVPDEEGGMIRYECRYGYPSDRCEECSVEDCEETCTHFEADIEEDEIVTVRCAGCGKELSKAVKDDVEGDVFCVDCYFKR